MRALKTNVNTNSQQYKDNLAEMLKLVDKLNKHLEESRIQGSENTIKKARSQGKLLARERLELLLDPDTPFLEIQTLIGLEADGFGAGGTIMGGIGIVSGKLVFINSNVGTKKGGSVDSYTVQKGLRFSEIADENGLPTINLVESGGAFLPHQAKVFNFGGRMFRGITRRSRKGNPTVSVVFGNATAGGAYIPGVSDYTVFVKQQAHAFLAGPPLVKMATNEVTDAESLGGAEMHSKISGVSDYLAEDEKDAIRLAREIIATLKPANEHQQTVEEVEEPLYSADEILGIISPDIKKPFESREIIARIVDGSKFAEFKPEYGNTLVTGWAKIHGYPVGFIANNGVLFSEAAQKATHFIQLCNQNNTPIIYLQNTTGFMVGKKYEEEGIIKNGAKLINAVSNSDVPTITVLIGSSFGAGNYGMNGLSYQPRFLFAYPNTRLAAMGAEQLAGVMDIVQRGAAKSRGLEIDEEKMKALKQKTIENQEKVSSAWFCTGQGWDDGVIDPRETRHYLGMCLTVLNNQPIKGSDGYGIYRM